MALTIQDDEKLQLLYPEHKIELRGGEITIVSPSDITSGLIAGRLLTRLNLWIEPRRLGFVFDSSSGFRPAEGELTAPGVAYISRRRLPRVPRSYGQIVPDLVVEVKSSTDRVKLIEDKLVHYLEVGAQVGILVDPDEQTVSIYRPNQAPVVLAGEAILSLPELLPGWQLPIAELWIVEFGDE